MSDMRTTSEFNGLQEYRVVSISLGDLTVEYYGNGLVPIKSQGFVGGLPLVTYSERKREEKKIHKHINGTNHGKLNTIFRLCEFNTQMRAYITMLNKRLVNAMYNLL